MPSLQVDTGLLVVAFCAALLHPCWFCSEPFDGGFLCRPSLSSLPLLWLFGGGFLWCPFVLVGYVLCLLLTVLLLKLLHVSKQVGAMTVLSGALMNFVNSAIVRCSF